MAGSLLAARGGPEALLLQDGRVLIMGGRSAQGTTPFQQEIFDPVLGRSSPAGTWSQPRQGFTATLLADGRVLVVGGYEDLPGISPYLAATLLFDPASRTWSDAASLAHPRARHTATLLPDGRVLLLGGGTDLGVFAADEIYDPVSDTWSDAPPMLKPRVGHTATRLADGRVLVVGGTDSGDGSSTFSQLVATDRVELFDPGTDTWSIAASMPTRLFGHTATLLRDGKVLVAGGTDQDDTPWMHLEQAYMFMPATGAWTEAGRMDVGRFHHRATLLADGRVLVGGGDTFSNLPTVPALFDPSTGTWDSTGSMVHPRSGFTVLGVPDGRGLAFGGGWGSELFESVEAID